jgi:hypothetical protein
LVLTPTIESSLLNHFNTLTVERRSIGVVLFRLSALARNFC